MRIAFLRKAFQQQHNLYTNGTQLCEVSKVLPCYFLLGKVEHKDKTPLQAPKPEYQEQPKTSSSSLSKQRKFWKRFHESPRENLSFEHND